MATLLSGRRVELRVDILGDAAAFFVEGCKPVFRDRMTLLRRLFVPLRRQGKLSCGGQVFGIMGREFELSLRVARLSARKEVAGRSAGRTICDNRGAGPAAARDGEWRLRL